MSVFIFFASIFFIILFLFLDFYRFSFDSFRNSYFLSFDKDNKKELSIDEINIIALKLEKEILNR